MDYSESTKVVFQRIEKLDPENVSKIIGHLLLKDNSHLEMIRLAFCPDTVIHSTIHTVKTELMNHSLSPTSTNANLPANLTPFTPSQWIVPTADQKIVFVDDQTPPIIRCNSHFPEPTTPQVCQSFNQGYCKYGGTCRYLHMLRMENGSFMVLNPPSTKTQLGGEDNYDLSKEFLKQLEIELVALLKARRAVPVSISSLPIFYYDKYGRVLQVEGYLMEVPGQGNVSFTLIQLIGWMTKGIRLIDRPHGRQSIILEEDIPRYMRLIEEQSGEDEWMSCQVYLTFPPHSMFSEEDVYSYFNNFGAVQEVRLPNQEKRMFGFVTFVFRETVALVLTKTNPHYICESKVLVKPYRMKPMLDDSGRREMECEKMKKKEMIIIDQRLGNKKQQQQHMYHVGETSSTSASEYDDASSSSSSSFILQGWLV